MEIDVKSIFTIVEKYCDAIYYGGSRVDPVIDNPHDYDYICFSKRLQKQNLLRCLRKNKLRVTWSNKNTMRKSKTKEELLKDFSQVRVFPYTQITWFSYLDILMVKVIGEDICPKTDIIFEHREEFIIRLKEKVDELLCGKIGNQKRWYHILRGVYILINNSYEVSEEQKNTTQALKNIKGKIKG